MGGWVGGQTDTSQPPVQIRNGSHSSPELQGRLGKWSDWDCLTGWWRRLARVLSLVYCQYYRPHVAISPEFRGRASDQSSDCWAPVSQCYSDHPGQRTPPATAKLGITKENFYSALKQNRYSSGSLKLCKNYRIFFLTDYSFQFFEKDFSVEFSLSKKFPRNSY